MRESSEVGAEAVEAVEAAAAEEANCPIKLELSPVASRVLQGDPGRIQQIIVNLLSNAVKFTEAGEIVVRASSTVRDDGRAEVLVSVKDTGIGIAPDAQQRLFRSFSQADESTTRRFGGTGLGLAIARGFVDVTGGMLEVDDTPGGGTTFTITMPVTPVAPDAHAADTGAGA